MAEGALKQQGHVPRPVIRRTKPVDGSDFKDPEPSEDDEVREWLEEQDAIDNHPVGGQLVQPEPSPDPDFWRISGDSLVRYHQQARKKLFVPEEGDCPSPLKYIEWPEQSYAHPFRDICECFHYIML